MNTTRTTTEDVFYFGTTLRVTTKAVELHDRSYRLDSVRSAQAIRVRSNRTMLGFLFALAAFVLVTLYLSLSIVLDLDPNLVWTGFGIIALLICLGFNLAFVIGLVIFYRSTMKSWHYIYVARLQRKLWHTDIAVSLHPEPVDRVVAAVNQALDMVRNGGTPTEPATLYYEEHSIRIDDSGMDIDGQVYAIDTVRYASIDSVTTIPWYMLAFSHLGVFSSIYLFTYIFNGIGRDVPAELRMVLFISIGVGMLLIVLAAGRFIQYVNKDKHMPASYAYECKLHTANETFLAFASVDQAFTRAAVDAVNAAVRRQAPSAKKRPSATRPSQRSIP